MAVSERYEMPTDASMLREFISIGQELLRSNLAARYGSDHARIAPSPSLVFPQPGLLGDDYRGVVVLNRNPGVGANRSDLHRVWDRELEKWLRQGTSEAYRDVYSLWERDLAAWDIWTDWIRPALSRAGLTESNICFLNLFKCATPGNKPPTATMYRTDWAITKRQIELVAPSVVLTSTDAAIQLMKSWPNPPFRLLVQNRARARAGMDYAQLQAARRAEADAIARELVALAR